MESITKIIGERIRAYRNKKKWSQEELAEKAGCHYTYIGCVERGEKVPTIQTIFKICKVLDLPMEILFKNIIGGKEFNEIPNKFYQLVSLLPDKEQEELYALVNEIIQYRKNNY